LIEDEYHREVAFVWKGGMRRDRALSGRDWHFTKKEGVYEKDIDRFVGNGVRGIVRTRGESRG
jgi:hypothetical protein